MASDFTYVPKLCGATCNEQMAESFLLLEAILREQFFSAIHEGGGDVMRERADKLNFYFFY